MNGETYEIEWETESIWWFQYHVKQILLENIDDDPALEVIYWVDKDFKIHVYDGDTQTEEYQSDEYAEMSALDIADLNSDNHLEFCIGDKDGNLTLLDFNLNLVLSQISLINEEIKSLKIVNIDSTKGKRNARKCR